MHTLCYNFSPSAQQQKGISPTCSTRCSPQRKPVMVKIHINWIHQTLPPNRILKDINQEIFKAMFRISLRCVLNTKAWLRRAQEFNDTIYISKMYDLVLRIIYYEIPQWRSSNWRIIKMGNHKGCLQRIRSPQINKQAIEVHKGLREKSSIQMPVYSNHSWSRTGATSHWSGDRGIKEIEN